ncbi:glycosyltransferase family 2 protein [Mangrovimonas aestuarii]|uniref:glycosyltransferase family 2 protein n=1 Tax=Mangrovimonas aestuarii TaxID=3018443 RepID=UPI0023793595|nr:glycosyltransferase family 2 protein [Mangrovimonas aestuarii]
MGTKETKISVVVPLYNEEDSLKELYSRLTKVLQSTDMDYEIIMVNDGSTDATLSIVKDFECSDNHIKYRSFSRNFGHQSAVTAGIEVVSGDCAVLIDADLQDPPELILEMLKKWREGYHVVYAQRYKRNGETYIKKLSSRLFYRFLSSLTEIDIPVDTGDFRLIDRKIVDVLQLLPEKQRYTRGLVSWAGFNQIGIPYTRDARYAGKSHYSIRKLMVLGLSGVISFSNYPLMIISVIGFFLTLLGVLASIYVLFIKLFTENVVPGWTSLILVVLFIGGLNMAFMGVIGVYVGNIVAEIKGRPVYIVEEERLK